jgi:hypothetical protein
LFFPYGGPSRLDIWDLTPEAPAEIRGELKPIATRVPGMQICEHLPKFAERAERLAILRSLTNDSRAHGSACHRMLTGHRADARRRATSRRGARDTANCPSLKNRLLPPLDLASSVLIDDLVATGRFDETLLVWTGEFGRTPRIQGDGRGHYSRCFSSMLAGGGIVHGASDATGSAPARDPVSPGDLIATIYHLLGFAADAKLTDRMGHVHPLFPGHVVIELLT